MRDMGRSDDPRVQAQLDRLGTLSIQRDTLGLDAITELLRRLGDPHKRLPPTFHVAGTNGKGSTCAFLRAMLEAEGYTVHVTTSPHLVRYNERFRVAGKLIEDARLADLLEEVFDAAEGLGCSFFEITIAAAFTEFARVPSDACVVEVGLGGRLDATNVLEPDVLAACGIAALGIDHEKFLLAPEEGAPEEPMARIAWEKAGIAKAGVPLASMDCIYPPEARASLRKTLKRAKTPHLAYGREWACDDWVGGIYMEGSTEILTLPSLKIGGSYQYENAGLAIAMLRSQGRLQVSESSIFEGLKTAKWPARLQRLSTGPLATLTSQSILLDGGHNANAGQALAESLGSSIHLILGMIEGKDPRSLLDPLDDRIRSLRVVQIPGHPSYLVEAFGPDAVAADSIEDALLGIPSDGHPILIAGSLYLAGEVLRLNDELPD